MSSNIRILLNNTVSGIDCAGEEFRVRLESGESIDADAVLLTIGYRLFDAHRKEEYGYGIYNDVITSVDFEKMLAATGTIVNHKGEAPRRVGFVHCVGSRDVKTGNPYCSKVCCVTAVKQALETKLMHPEAEVFCFYMDLRMFGRHFETLYLEAQEKGVQFIRGRLSEATEDIEGNVMVKVEDTLAGRPLKMTVNLLVLMVGMEATDETPQLAESIGAKLGADRFFLPPDEHTLNNISSVPGVFWAGACTSPKSISETLADARASVSQIDAFLFAQLKKKHKVPVN